MLHIRLCFFAFGVEGKMIYISVLCVQFVPRLPGSRNKWFDAMPVPLVPLVRHGQHHPVLITLVGGATDVFHLQHSGHEATEPVHEKRS